jgi:hypothetical protein
MPDPHAPVPSPDDETQETEQQHTTTVLGEPSARPASRVLPAVLFWVAVVCWASGTLVFWTSVYFGTESLRRLASDPTYENPYAELDVIWVPILSAWAWLPLLFIAMFLAVSSRMRNGPHPRLASAIAWLVLSPFVIVCVLVVGFVVFVRIRNLF